MAFNCPKLLWDAFSWSAVAWLKLRLTPLMTTPLPIEIAPDACGAAVVKSMDSFAYPGVLAFAMLLPVTLMADWNACKADTLIPNTSDTITLRPWVDVRNPHL